MPGLQEVSTIDARKHSRLVKILNSEAIEIGGIQYNLNSWNDSPFTCRNITHIFINISKTG
jgi:hypothetical protein